MLKIYLVNKKGEHLERGLEVDDLKQLADFIKERNLLERKITALINRPATIGHLGEYIASKIFHIALEESASHKSSDGCFRDGLLKGRAVNIKWYAMREGLLDITPDALPDHYLVLTGPKSNEVTSKGRVRPWIVVAVFLFDAHDLVTRLQASGVKMGIASSVAQQLWEEAEIYPNQRNTALILSGEQRKLLASFSDNAVGMCCS